MVPILVLVGIAAGGGALLGARLAARGITADNALIGRQRLAYALLAAVAGVGAVTYWAAHLPALPVSLYLFLDDHVMDLGRGIAGFAVGLLVALEWPGRAVAKRRANLVGGGLVLALGAAYLLYRATPVAGTLRAPGVFDDVVMQTTAYTCAPASIATLLRVTGRDTAATEAQVVAVAGTTREGTSSRAELRAMRALGLAPRFARRLTVDSLITINQPAVLHVNEPVGATTIRHAVALIGVDTVRHVVRIGNPLHGEQAVPFSGLQGYWLGEAVFATSHTLQAP